MEAINKMGQADVKMQDVCLYDIDGEIIEYWTKMHDEIVGTGCLQALMGMEE
ncbi:MULTISPECIES: hypothetical protein [Methanobacterium]|uniref:hypothetical protein n=1 Tax=Methanobacterium TaxID=2160 RepID=UPI00159F1850|nr:MULTISPECIES: hypothetical protein [Methanobacterium]